MKPKVMLSLTFYVLRLTLAPIVALSLAAASLATASADSQSSATYHPIKVKYTKKYVKVVGSNIPVPVWVAEGPLPKTTYPVRSYDYNEISKIPGAYTPAQVLANDPSITIIGRH